MTRSLIALVALLPTLVSAQLDPNRVVATVNGDEIKAGEYYHRMEWYRIDPQTAAASLPAGFLTIKQLITERLLDQMAKKKGIAPTKPELDAAYNDTVNDNPELLKTLNSAGRSDDELRDQIEHDLVRFKLQTAGITITDQELENHYKQYPDEFRIPKQFRVRVIVVTDPNEKSKVDSELAAGKSFADVATAHSLDASRLKGGEFGYIPARRMADGTRKAIEAVKIGQTTQWIEDAAQGGSKVKFLLEEITPEKLLPLDAAAKKRLRRQMMIDKGRVSNPVEKDLQAAATSAKITINQPEFQKLFDQLMGRTAPTAG